MIARTSSPRTHTQTREHTTHIIHHGLDTAPPHAPDRWRGFGCVCVCVFGAARRTQAAWAVHGAWLVAGSRVGPAWRAGILLGGGGARSVRSACVCMCGMPPECHRGATATSATKLTTNSNLNPLKRRTACAVGNFSVPPCGTNNHAIPTAAQGTCVRACMAQRVANGPMFSHRYIAPCWQTLRDSEEPVASAALSQRARNGLVFIGQAGWSEQRGAEHPPPHERPPTSPTCDAAGSFK